jgi:hypothetical protein
VVVKRLFLGIVLALAAAIVLVPGAAAGNFDEPRMGCSGESPAICAMGTEGVPYSMPIELGGDEDEGCATFHVTSGSLPPGLSITRNVVNESGHGLISGTPTQAGTYRFFLTVRLDREPHCVTNCGSKCSSDDEFSITVNPGIPKLTIGPEQSGVPVGTVAAPYTLQMTATVPDAKTWTISSGTLPAGLTLGSSNGLISGSPTTAGTSTFTVRAEINPQRVDTKTLTITVRDQLVLAATEPFTAERRAPGEVGLDFEAELTATGGAGTYTWSLTGTLPPGLTHTNGVITGTPTAAGSYAFVVTVTDTEARVVNYPARIVVAERLAVRTLRLRAGKVGKRYLAKLSTVGGFRPTAWRVVRGPLPRGIRFNRALGTLAGTPKKAGSYRIVFEATDALGVTAKKTLRLKIAPTPKKKSRR